MNNDLHIIYRISDKGNVKSKISNKKECLLNTIKEFGKDNLYILADNCSDETLNWLYSLNLIIEETSNGNSGTIKYIFNELINKYNDNDYLYLLEDDYLHLSNSKKILLEGLEIADYVTLYDHPDMYHINGDNPFMINDLVKSYIFLTDSSHWRSVISTTMTFAAKVKTLKEDKNIFIEYCDNKIPLDFLIFISLTKQEDIDKIKLFSKLGLTKLVYCMLNNLCSERTPRLLISPLPALATHTDINYLALLINWIKLERKN